MKPIHLSDETRALKAPSNWSDEDGECGTLSIYDHETANGNVMISAWLPDEQELEALRKGAILYLHIYGAQHPVVGLSIQNV